MDVLSDVKGCRQRVNEELQMRALASQHAKVLVLSYFQCECGEWDAAGPHCSECRNESG